jgi:hypothetical protein
MFNFPPASSSEFCRIMPGLRAPLPDSRSAGVESGPTGVNLPRLETEPGVGAGLGGLPRLLLLSQPLRRSKCRSLDGVCRSSGPASDLLADDLAMPYASSLSSGSTLLTPTGYRLLPEALGWGAGGELDSLTPGLAPSRLGL